MARMKKVFVMDLTDGPDEYASRKAALAANPKRSVVDAYFPTEEQAMSAARRINYGDRGEWPNDTYFGVYVPNPSPSDPDSNTGLVKDAWYVNVGMRPHIPEGWKKWVNRKKENSEPEPVPVGEAPPMEDPNPSIEESVVNEAPEMPEPAVA